MKFCTTEGMTESGPTVIEYEYPTMSAATKDDMADIHDNYEQDIKKENDGNTAITDKQHNADNVFHMEACEAEIAKEYTDKDKTIVKTKKNLLRLPLCPESGIQLASHNDMWQGDTYEARPESHFAIKGRFQFALFEEEENGLEFEGTRYQIIWEIPVLEQGKSTLKTTPIKAAVDQTDKLAAAKARRANRGGRGTT